MTSYRTKKNVNVEARVENDAVRVIEYAHVAVHDDAFAIVSDYVADIDVASPRSYLMIAPANTELHVLFGIDSSAPVVVEIFTEPTITANGTEILHFRPNLWSAQTVKTSYHTPTLSDEGALVYKVRSGGTAGANAQQSIGGSTRSGEEIIIPGGEAIHMKITATVDNTKMSVVGEYYEVPSGATNPAA